MSHLRLPLVLLASVLCGCSGLFHSSAPELQLYVLQPPQPLAVTAGAARSAGATLRIARPLPAPGLDTDRIALTRPGSRLDYYAGSRWSAPLADVVSDLLLAVFRNDPVWSAVVDERATLNADYLLQTSIARFSADYAAGSGAPTVRIDLHCLLLRRSDGVLLGSFAVSRSAPAAANRMADVVAVFSAAADQALIELQAQADQQLRSVKSPAAP